MNNKKDFCLVDVHGYRYLYDFINCTFQQYDTLVYLLLEHLELFPISNIKSISAEKIKQENSNISKYSVNEIKIALNEVETIFQRIEKKKKLTSFYQYPLFKRTDIIKSLVRTTQIVIELTEKCNLDCTYCCYGDLYNNTSRNKKKNDSNSAITYLETLLNLKKEYLNSNIFESLVITFYGGEPLLNMNTIVNAVELISKIASPKSKIQYTITTNAVLIDKYIDFLIENDFKIYISLDGSRFQDEYRKFPNGTNSFDIVESNILLIQRKFPTFFKENIFFLTVLHNKNNILDVCDYFGKYDKFPSFSPLSKENLRVEKKTKFTEMSQLHTYSMRDIQIIKKKYPIIYNMYFNNQHRINSLLNPDLVDNVTDLLNDDLTIYPGGSCFLFENRVFVAIDGRLFLCEKSDRQFCFGKIHNGNIFIYRKRINDYYQTISSVFRQKCVNCYKKSVCDKCYFQESENICEGHCLQGLSDIYSILKKTIETNEIEL